MYLSFWITALALLGDWGLPTSHAQFKRNEDVEDILTQAAQVHNSVLEQLEHGYSTSNCLIQGIKSRSVDVLQLKFLADSVMNQAATPSCNTLENEWQYDFRNLFQSGQSSLRQQTSQTCGKFPSVVLQNIQMGQQVLTKKIIQGLLKTIQPNVRTPDAITLLETIAKIAAKCQLSDFYANPGTSDIIREITTEIQRENLLEPSEHYQLALAASSQVSIRINPHFHIFSLIHPAIFPPDVIKARDQVAIGIVNGTLEACPETGWQTPDDHLLSFLTSLTKIPNNHPLAAPIHVLFSHHRMWYLCQHGYYYAPKTFNDIVFLLNSFLTVRNPKLLKEVYQEFKKIPLQDYTSKLDFTQYCDPRSLTIGIIKSILANKESMETCNTILFSHFIEAEDDNPHWSTTTPLEVIPPEGLQQTTTTTPPEAPKQQCSESEERIVDRNSLLELFNNGYSIIVSIVKENPFPAKLVLYNTRGMVFKQIFNELLKKRTDYDVTRKLAMMYAANDLQLNEKGLMRVEYECISADEINEMNLICEKGERMIIDPESFIEMFNETNFPHTAQLLRDYPMPMIKSESRLSAYRTYFLLFKTALNGIISDEITWELYTINAQLEANKSALSRLPAVFKCVPYFCNKFTVISPESLLEIIEEDDITLIKKIVYSMQPIMGSSYLNRETRETVLKSVLKQSYEMYNDKIGNLISPQVIERLRINRKGSLQPEFEVKCEEDPKYNGTYEPAPEEDMMTCEKIAVIDQESLVEIIIDKEIAVIRNLIFMEPIFYAHYKEIQSREELLRKVLQDRMVQVNDAILNLVIPASLDRMQISWRGMLPPIVKEVCKRNLVYNIVTQVTPINEDDLICDEEEEKIAMPPICRQGEKGTLIADTLSLFDALNADAPPATVTRQKILSFIYPIYSRRRHLKGYVLRDILVRLRDESASARLDREIDQLLVSIKYTAKGLEPVETKFVCLDIASCAAGERMTHVIDVRSVMAAFRPGTKIPLGIRNIIMEHLIPVDLSQVYKKGDMLRKILYDVLSNLKDSETRNQIQELLDAVLEDGPARHYAPTVLRCVTENAIKPCDNDLSTGPVPPLESQEVTTNSIESSEEKTDQDDGSEELCKETEQGGMSCDESKGTTRIEIEKNCDESDESAEPTTNITQDLEDCEDGTPTINMPPLQPTTSDPAQSATYVELHEVDALGCDDPEPWWQNQCSCEPNETLIQSFLTCDIYNQLPYLDQELRSKISKTVFPVQVYTGLDRREILNQILATLNLTEKQISWEFPRVTAVCVEHGLYQNDELNCTVNRAEPYCVYPVEFIATKALLKSIYDQAALAAAVASFNDTDTRAQILNKILVNIHNDTEARLGGDRQVRTSIQQQVGFLKEKIYWNGEETARNSNDLCLGLGQHQRILSGSPKEYHVTRNHHIALVDDMECSEHQWPLLLKVNYHKLCYDELSYEFTRPVDVIWVGELLDGAEGNYDEKYVLSAKLAGLDTYGHMQSFDWGMYCTRAEFLSALIQHIDFKTNIVQRSTEPITIHTICRRQLLDALPNGNRQRRDAATVGFAPGVTSMEQAMEIAKKFIA